MHGRNGLYRGAIDVGSAPARARRLANARMVDTRPPALLIALLLPQILGVQHQLARETRATDRQLC